MSPAYQFSLRNEETFLTSSNHGINRAIRVTTTIATRPDGRDLVSFGRNWIIAIVKRIRPSMMSISTQASQCSHTLNCSTCARNIIIAKPFTNHNITECGISLTSFPRPNIPKAIWSDHMSTRVAKRNSTP